MTPYERSRKVLEDFEGTNVRRELERSDLPIELATAIADVCEKALQPESKSPVDWEEIDRLDALGTFGARIIPYNGVWKIMLNETNCELWSLKTHAEAEAKLTNALDKSGYSDDENPLVELARLKALRPEEKESIVRNNPDGSLDELFAEGSFHIEQMAAAHWWIGINARDKFFHVNLHSNAKIAASLIDEPHHASPSMNARPVARPEEREPK